MLELILTFVMELIQDEHNKICAEMNATCGVLVSEDEFIDCGKCYGKFELCGGAAPKYDGTIGNGEPLTCGGGCSEVGIFSCPIGKTAVMCSIAGRKPHESCQAHESLNNEGKWCCERY